jgi:twitching motility protein PilT
MARIDGSIPHMSLIDSLVSAMLQHDGEALVLHVGEKPYVVTVSGNVEISPRELTFDAMTPMLEQLLSPGSQSQLDEFGAVEDHLATSLTPEGERMTVVVARGGEDIWIELRRHRPEPEAEEPIAEPAVADPLPPIEVRDLVAPARTEPEASSRPTLVPPSRPEPAKTPDPEPIADPSVVPGVVVPMRRATPAERSARPARDDQNDLERLLRIAATRNATMLYVVTGAKPSLRVDGEVRQLDTERNLTADEIEALVLAMMTKSADPLRRGVEAEWVRDLPDVGRVRCTRFQDHRGPGAIFQLIGARAISADELGLPRGIRELAEESEGLILLTGARASGKSTLFAAIIDLINRARSAHVITLEPQIKFVHENRSSIVSQREVRGDNEAVLNSARAALREAPDVLAIEDLHARDLFAFALQAAESGLLVVGTIAANGAVPALERVMSQVSEDRRATVQRAISDTLRGVAAQMLLRKVGGGRIAARELLRNTYSVAALIADGSLAQIPRAMEQGRRAGMITFNESLFELVRDKAVDVREAYRHSPDRDALVKLFEREGMDTSFVERMA